MPVAAFSCRPLHLTRLKRLLKAKRVDDNSEEQQPATDLQELKQPAAFLEVNPRRGLAGDLKIFLQRIVLWFFSFLLYKCNLKRQAIIQLFLGETPSLSISF